MLPATPTIAHLTTTPMSHAWLLLRQLRAFREKGFHVIAMAGPGPHADVLAKHGIPFVQIPSLTRRMLDPVADARAVVQLAQAFIRHRVDLLHTHMPKAGLLGRLAARIASVPAVVHTVHGLYLPENASRRWRWFVRLIEQVGGACTHHLFAQNPDDLTVLHGWGVVPPEALSLLGNGVDLRRFAPRPEDDAERLAVRKRLQVPPDGVLVGMVARLVAAKGCRDFLSATRALVDRHPQLHAVLVGPWDPVKGDALTPAEVEVWASHPRLTCAGPQSAMPDWYAAMDVAVLPSRFPEGIPRALIEPAAMGKPLIATTVKGCREVVRHEENGLQVPPNDLAALTAAIERLATSPTLRSRFGEASARIAREHFDEETVIAKTFAVYRRLLVAR